MPGQQADGEQEDLPQEEQELTDAMRRLSEILREQRQLSDDTRAQQRGETPGQSGQEQGGQQPGQQSGTQQGQDSGQPGGGEAGSGQTEAPQGGGDENGERPGSGGGEFAEGNEGEGSGPGQSESLAERQARLGRLVEEFAREHGLGETGSGDDALAGRVDPDALDDIRRAQRQAQNALDRGDEAGAVTQQELATNTLSQVARDMAERLDTLERERRGQNSQQSDPFGRPTGGPGNNGEEVNVPDATERQRAKDILEELRERYNDSDDPEEREYLRRLLDRF